MASISNPDRILIVRPDALGDVLLTLPLIRSVKATFPMAKIMVIAQAYTQPILMQEPSVDRVIVDWKRAGQIQSFLDIIKYARYLRSFNFSQVYLPYLDGFYAALVLMAGIPIRIGNGQQWPVRLLLTHPISLPYRNLALHEVELTMMLLSKFQPKACLKPFEALRLLPENVQQANACLKQAGYNEGPYVVVHTSTGGSNRAWAPEHYAQLCDVFWDQFGLQAILTGVSEQECATVHTIQSLCKHRPISVAGRTSLDVLKGILAGAKAVVGTDTGPLHMAAALKVPVMCLSPTKFTKSLRYGPWLPPQVVVNDTTTCFRSCFPRTCLYTDCLDALSMDRVSQSFKQLLQHPYTGLEACRAHWFQSAAHVGFYLDHGSQLSDLTQAALSLNRSQIPVYIMLSSKKWVAEVVAQCPWAKVTVIMPFNLKKWSSFMVAHDLTVLHIYSNSNWIKAGLKIAGQLAALKMYCPPLMMPPSRPGASSKDMINAYFTSYGEL